MLPDRVSNSGLLTYESGALLIVLRGPARYVDLHSLQIQQVSFLLPRLYESTGNYCFSDISVGIGFGMWGQHHTLTL